MKHRNIYAPLFIALGAASLAISASILAPDRTIAPAHASNLIGDQSPTLALLVTKPGALHTSLYLTTAGAASPSAPVATFNHLPNAFVRGRVVPNTPIVLAIADTDPSRDKSFNSSLFVLQPHTPPNEICNSLVYGMRPLVMQSGRVFIARGKAGPEAPDSSLSRLRTDELSIAEIDLASGALRTIHTFSGYITFLAGAIGNELVLYRASQSGADLVAVDADSGNVRPILPSLPPFARDFSIDESRGLLAFRNRHESNRKLWTIEQMDLRTQKLTRLLESPSMTLSPHLWPTGGIAYNPYAQSGLALLDGQPPIGAPLGQGIDVVTALSADGKWAALEHTFPGALSIPFVLETKTGIAKAVAVPPGTSVEIAGFIAGSQESVQ